MRKIVKKMIALSMVLILLFPSLISCDFFEYQPFNKGEETTSNRFQETTKTPEHVHQWQDVSGEHASICTECNEKQLKPEACNWVRENCDLPAVCTICHAVSDEFFEEHDWNIVRQTSDCWSTTVTRACSKCSMQEVFHGDSALPRHSWAEETADSKTTFSCTRCNESFTFVSEIRAFNYAQVLEEYKIGDPGVKHEHFNNWNIESEITGAIDAITRAKFELTVEYDITSVSYDENANMWCVTFWTLDMPGGDQSVYLNGNGLTCYIIYGE